MNNNYQETVDRTIRDEYSAAIEAPNDTALESPLDVLSAQVSQLTNCLAEYKRRLIESLTESENSRTLGGIRISITTLALFGIVGAFALILNLSLRSMNASDAHLLRANIGMAVLYLLIAISALNDLSRGRTRWRTEREALNIRTQDVAEQFAELASMRQTWVQELTRSQWMSETEKLKLQLVLQELEAKQTSLDESHLSLSQLLSDIKDAEGVQSKLQADVARANEQLSQAEQGREHAKADQAKLDAQCNTTQREVERLRGEVAAQTAQHEQLAGQLRNEESSLEAMTGKKAELESQCEELQQKVDLLEQLASELNQAQLELDQQLIAEKNAENNAELNRLIEEIAANERKLLDQVMQIEDTANAVSKSQAELFKLNEAIAANRSEGDELAQLNEKQRNELAARKNELKELQASIELLRTEQQSVTQELDENKQQLADLQTQYEQTLGQLAVLGTQLVASKASQQVLAAQNALQVEQLARQETALNSQALTLQEIDLQIADRRAALTAAETALAAAEAEELQIKARVDWLLNRMGEFERLAAVQVASIHISDQELHEQRAEVLAAQGAVQIVSAELERATHDLVLHETKLSELKEEYAAIESVRMAAETQLQVTEAKTQTAEQQAQDLVAKAEAMADQIELWAEELLSAKQAVADLKDELTTLETMKTQYDRLASDSEALDYRLDEQRDLADALAGEIDAKQIQVNALQQLIDADSKTATELADRLESLDIELAKRLTHRGAVAEETESMLQSQMRIQQELHAVEESLFDKMARLQGAESELDSLQQECDALSRDVISKRSEVDDLDSDIARRQEDCAAVLQAGLAASEQCSVATDELSRAEEGLRSARLAELELRTAVDGLTQTRDELRAKLGTLTDEVHEAEAIAGQWQSYVEKIQAERAKLEASSDQLIAKCETLAELAKQRESALDQLNDQQAAAAQRYEHLMSETCALELTLKCVREDLVRDESEHANRRFEISRSEALLEELNVQQNVAEKRLAAAEQQLTKLDAAVAAVQAEKQRLEDACEGADQRLMELQRVCGELTSDEVELKGRSQQLSLAIEACEEQLAGLQSQIELSSAERSSLADELKHQAGQLQTHEAEIVKRRKELLVVERACAEQQDANVQLERLHAERKEELEQLKVDVAGYQTHASQLARETAAAQGELDRLQKECDASQQSLAEVQREERMHQQQILDAQAQVLELDGERKKLSRKTKRARLALDELLNLEQQTELRRAELQTTLDAQLNELQRNRIGLDELRQQQVAVEASLAAQTLQSEKQLQRMDEQLATIESLESRIQSARAAKLALEKSLSGVMSEREAVVVELKQLELDLVQATVVRAELDQNRVMHATLASDIKVLQRGKVELDEGVQAMRTEMEQLKASRDELEEALRDFERQAEERERLAQDVLAKEEQIRNAALSVLEPELPLVAKVEMSLPPESEDVAKSGRIARNDIESDIWSTVQSLSMLGRRGMVTEQKTESEAAIDGAALEEPLDPWAMVTGELARVR